jgi:hypothetical protein
LEHFFEKHRGSGKFITYSVAAAATFQPRWTSLIDCDELETNDCEENEYPCLQGMSSYA